MTIIINTFFANTNNVIKLHQKKEKKRIRVGGGGKWEYPNQELCY